MPNSAIIWEPLFKYRKHKNNRINPFAYPEIHESGFTWNQPIPENAQWDEAHSFIKKLINKEIVNLKIYRFNDLQKINRTQNFIYKFCYGNLILSWFVKHFDVKSILFVRHPAAVIASQLKRGWTYTKQNPEYIVNKFRYNEVFLLFEDILKTVKTPEENLAATWAVTNLLPLSDENNDIKWLTVAYENMFLNPEFEIQRIAKRFEINFPDGVYNTHKKQSFTSNETIDGNNRKKQLYKWKDYFSKKQIDNIFGIINAFNFDVYQKDGPIPDLTLIYNDKTSP